MFYIVVSAILAVLAGFVATSATTPKAPPIKCLGCGKVISNPSAIKAGMGQLCARHVAGGNTKAKLLQHRQANTVQQPPNGWVKLAVVGRTIRARQGGSNPLAGLNVNRLVLAIGKDRGLLPPVAPICLPVYLPNGIRYVHPWLNTTAGLKAIASGNYKSAPAMPKIAYIKA